MTLFCLTVILPSSFLFAMFLTCLCQLFTFNVSFCLSINWLELFFQTVTLVICDKGRPIFSLYFIFSNFVSLAFSLFYFTISIVNCLSVLFTSFPGNFLLHQPGYNYYWCVCLVSSHKPGQSWLTHKGTQTKPRQWLSSWDFWTLVQKGEVNVKLKY